MSADDLAWWDDLPPGSIVEVNRQVLHRDIDGTWWYGLMQIWPDQDIAPEIREKVRVIEVPVTDVEPPVGSLVDGADGVWLRDLVRWRLYADPTSIGLDWQSLRPLAHVTRILRWGE